VAICPVAKLFPEGNTLTRRVRGFTVNIAAVFASLNLFFSCGVRFFISASNNISVAVGAEPQYRISGSKSCNLFLFDLILPEGEAP
jgi:hypothetical protein